MISPHLQRAMDAQAALDELFAGLMDATGMPIEAVDCLQAAVSRLALAHCCQELVDAKARLALRRLVAANG